MSLKKCDHVWAYDPFGYARCLFCKTTSSSKHRCVECLTEYEGIWIVISTPRSHRHFCSNKCAIKYLKKDKLIEVGL
jgi:hypothetical protein